MLVKRQTLLVTHKVITIVPEIGREYRINFQVKLLSKCKEAQGCNVILYHSVTDGTLIKVREILGHTQVKLYGGLIYNEICLRTGEWISFEFSQLFTKGHLMFVMKVNSNTVVETVIQKWNIAKNVTVYASYNKALHAYIRDFTFTKIY